MRQVIALDYRVILLFLWPDIAYQTLTVMYNLGVFGSKYLFIFCEHMQTTDLMQDRTSLPSNVSVVEITQEFVWFRSNCIHGCLPVSVYLRVCQSHHSPSCKEPFSFVPRLPSIPMKAFCFKLPTRLKNFFWTATLLGSWATWLMVHTVRFFCSLCVSRIWPMKTPNDVHSTNFATFIFGGWMWCASADALSAAILTIQKMRAACDFRNTSAAFMSFLRFSSFNGVTGPVSFNGNADNNRQFATNLYQLVNCVADKFSTVTFPCRVFYAPSLSFLPFFTRTWSAWVYFFWTSGWSSSKRRRYDFRYGLSWVSVHSHQTVAPCVTQFESPHRPWWSQSPSGALVERADQILMCRVHLFCSLLQVTSHVDHRKLYVMSLVVFLKHFIFLATGWTYVQFRNVAGQPGVQQIVSVFLNLGYQHQQFLLFSLFTRLACPSPVYATLCWAWSWFLLPHTAHAWLILPILLRVLCVPLYAWCLFNLFVRVCPGRETFILLSIHNVSDDCGVTPGLTASTLLGLSKIVSPVPCLCVLSVIICHELAFFNSCVFYSFRSFVFARITRTHTNIHTNTHFLARFMPSSIVSQFPLLIALVRMVCRLLCSGCIVPPNSLIHWSWRQWTLSRFLFWPWVPQSWICLKLLCIHISYVSIFRSVCKVKWLCRRCSPTRWLASVHTAHIVAIRPLWFHDCVVDDGVIACLPSDVTNNLCRLCSLFASCFCCKVLQREQA